MDQETVVDRLYQELVALEVSIDPNELSLLNTAGDVFRKTLLLAAASYFERRVVSTVLDFVGSRGRDNELVMEFVKNKALSRQYHTLFDWDKTNANKFFRLFGPSFQDHAKKRVATDEVFAEGVQAFLEIGRERNRLVHEDFGSFSLEKTADEIYSLYVSGLKFVVLMRETLETWKWEGPNPELPGSVAPAFKNRDVRLRWR